jgi:PAP2 superfamily
VVWFILLNVSWVYFGFYAPHGIARSRYFLSFMLIWMGGGWFAATVFSSAGPCFYSNLGLDPTAYGELMAHIKRVGEGVNGSAYSAQTYFWSLKVNDTGFSVISAMPSLHNATALLFVLAAWRMHKAVKWFAVVHAALVYVGSVALGWHYAVDAYAGWALTLLAWWIAKHLAIQTTGIVNTAAPSHAE